MQEQQTNKPKKAKQINKQNKELSTILENGESYIISPNKEKKRDILDIELSSKMSEKEHPQSTNQQQNKPQQKMNKDLKNKEQITKPEQQLYNEMDKAVIAMLQKDKKKNKNKGKISQKEEQEQSRKKDDDDDEKQMDDKSKQRGKKNKQKKGNENNEDQNIDEMMKDIQISLTNTPADLDSKKVDNDQQNENAGQVNEYEVSWNVFKFLIDKRIRWQEKLLFFVSLFLILSDMGASIFQFYVFANNSCFGYESEMEFSDVANIIASILLKICCINIIMQEITNTLPGNIQIPFLVPLSIMGITPNLQLNQYVYSFTSCFTINPVLSYGNARTITRLLCYLFIAIIGLICIVVIIIRIQISRQTWKRLKNVGFYILIGGFLLSMIFIFIFTSVLQINKEFLLSLCLDNVTFWVFMLICIFYTVRKIYYKKNPFPFTPSVVQQKNQQDVQNENKDDIETQRLTIENPQQPKSSLKFKQESSQQNEEIQENKEKIIVFSSQIEIKDNVQTYSNTQINQENEKTDKQASHNNLHQDNHNQIKQVDFIFQQENNKEDATTSASNNNRNSNKVISKNGKNSLKEDSSAFKPVIDTIEGENNNNIFLINQS